MQTNNSNSFCGGENFVKKLNESTNWDFVEEEKKAMQMLQLPTLSSHNKRRVVCSEPHKKERN